MEEVKKSLPLKRYEEMLILYEKGADALPELEALFYRVGGDLGLYNSQRGDMVREIVKRKKGMRVANKYKSIAEFDREYEETEEYILDREYKFAIRALEKMYFSIDNRIKALKAENKGQY